MNAAVNFELGDFEQTCCSMLGKFGEISRMGTEAGGVEVTVHKPVMSQETLRRAARQLRGIGWIAEAQMVEAFAQQQEALEPLRKWVEAETAPYIEPFHGHTVTPTVFHVVLENAGGSVTVQQLQAIFQQPTAGGES